MTMTYNSLVNQVMDYMNRSDANTLAEVSNFIYQAEQRIGREAKSIGFESYVTGSFTATNPVYPKPANWRRNISFNCGDAVGSNLRSPIQLRSYEFLMSLWPDRTLMNKPLFYSDYGFNNFLVAPTPDVAYPFEYAFLQTPTPISVVSQTSWLTDFAPDVLLNATLLEAMYFLKDDERIPVWEKKYATGIASLNGQDDMRVEDRQSNRSAD